MQYSVDRIEADIAVCEDANREKIEIPLSSLSKDVKEGDIVVYDGIQYCIDHEETEKRRQQAIALQKKLFKKNP